MDPLFPELPESLADLTDEELTSLLDEHLASVKLIRENDKEFTAGYSGAQIVEATKAGIEQIKAIQALQAERSAEVENFTSTIDGLTSEVLAEEETAEVEAEVAAEEEDSPEGDGDAGDEDGGEEEGGEEEASAESEAVAEPALVASAVSLGYRTPPAPSRERSGVRVSNLTTTALVAAAGVDGLRPGQELDRLSYAESALNVMRRRGKPQKHANGTEERILLGTVDIPFPEERTLRASDDERNAQKVLDVIPANTGWGRMGGEALTASGGLCAPLTPFYALPNFATQARPGRDALPSFRAERGGVNVPTPHTIGDITTAITVIDEAEDALGGTFATKSCQDFTCNTFTEVAVTIIAHCRSFGNMNARAWPESVAHENDLTMAAHARTAESYLLDRIKALSVNVTNGAETLGALIYLVDAIVKARFGIIGRLRMNPNTQFRALIPYWVPQMLVLDTVQTPFDRFRSEESLTAYLRSVGITPSYYLDTPSTGTTQLPDSAQTAAALDALPDNVQWALFPEGAFLHIDGGTLELGIVRDSTLNETNDFQVFGESFENVARIAPAQAAYWVTSDLCANGMFPPAGTARTCD